jgi:asparagine synthase (glutamine-hydrolysing)
MCGIAAVRADDAGRRAGLLYELLLGLAHRGQPEYQCETDDVSRWNVGLGTNRLAIVAPDTGRQPVPTPSGRYRLVFNGEVFNHRALAAELWGLGGFAGPAPDSDTAVLAGAIERWGPVAAVQRLNWEGVFVCVDLDDGALWAGRDHMGIKPLYHARAGQARLWASEIKALVPCTDGDIAPLPPGTVVRQAGGADTPLEFLTWWRPDDHVERYGPEADVEAITGEILTLAREAVRVRVPAGRYAMALSGGVDSSLILRLSHKVNPDVTAYVLRRPDSPDLPYAVSLCRTLGVPLVQVPAPAPEELDAALPEVVRSVETWEWHVVNHAAPMMALSEVIKAAGHRVVLSGEGADELFGGYGAAGAEPNPASVRAERLARLRDLHRTNCRRLDRIGMRSTLEFRVPFLDRALTEYALGLHPAWLLRRGQRKWALRAAAAKVLPREVAWRAKLSFARGAGYRYSPGTVPSVFSVPTAAGPVAPGWAGAPRFAAERVFLAHFLRYGYGRAPYLRIGSR